MNFLPIFTKLTNQPIFQRFYNQKIKTDQPLLDPLSAVVACVGINIIFSFAADKIINYYNLKEEGANEFSDPNDPVIERNRYVNSGLYLSCMVVVNIVAISQLFPVLPAKPSLMAGSVLAVVRHIYRDWCDRKSNDDIQLA